MALAAEAQFHVLAVDDSLIERKLIEKLLKTSSFLVTTVDSGSKALEFLGLRHDHGSPDQQDVEVNMVITDYCMPGMTGYDLLKKIKESSAFKNIPVVIMSSENVPARINRCLEEGAEEFLLKPVKLSDMNRLRPHILKWKSTGQQQRSNNNADLSTSSSNSGTSDHSITSNSSSVNSTYGSSTKRKAMDEGLPPEKKRHRFSSNSGNSLTVLRNI